MLAARTMSEVTLRVSPYKDLSATHGCMGVDSMTLSTGASDPEPLPWVLPKQKSLAAFLTRK